MSPTPVHSVVVTPLPCVAATRAFLTDYYEPHGVSPEEVVEAAMSLLLSLKVGRQTSGVLLSSQYPINYFSISQVSKGLGHECWLCKIRAASQGSQCWGYVWHIVP